MNEDEQLSFFMYRMLNCFKKESKISKADTRRLEEIFNGKAITVATISDYINKYIDYKPKNRTRYSIDINTLRHVSYG